MRYRALSDTLDYQINVPFLANSPQTVAQLVLTRLKLFQGEWFMDTTDGVPYFQSILGKQYGATPDAYIKQRILSTQGVTSIVSYSSSLSNRAYTITCTISTVYGATTVTTTL